MSSSISSSDTFRCDAVPSWGRWLAVFLGTLALGAALVFALQIVVDPYDSGRFGLLPIVGVNDENPRTAHASRARDKQFDAAIIGNSTGLILDPTILSAATGVRFVQLTIPLVGPHEQLAILDFFSRHHPRIGALVVMTDDAWCTDTFPQPLREPFPFWLYGDSDIDYLAQLFSSRALGRTVRRLRIALGLRQPSRPDGYWNWELQAPADRRPTGSGMALETLRAARASAPFPAISALGSAMAGLPAATPIVLVVPPIFHTGFPLLGSPTAIRAEACNAALSEIAARRPGTVLVNYRIDVPLARDPANFMDEVHYRAPIARKMEAGITAAIRDGKAPRIDF